jgi:hypothetical protein
MRHVLPCKKIKINILIGRLDITFGTALSVSKGELGVSLN